MVSSIVRAIALWCGLATLGCLAGVFPVVMLVFRHSGESRMRALTAVITSIPPRVRWSAVLKVLAGAVSWRVLARWEPRATADCVAPRRGATITISRTSAAAVGEFLFE
ncbi:hypothetical protein ACGFMK_20920 [Amycolatopsis sp. NPDC049252]|uniref:hypothetical protein n=1 Tax=Amycolatopsis sp. NPDC049252 TaxID=3363933 RepID=UPI00371D3380